MTDVPQEKPIKRKRRRLHTPPPSDDITFSSVDIYDKSVSSTVTSFFSSVTNSISISPEPNGRSKNLSSLEEDLTNVDDDEERCDEGHLYYSNAGINLNVNNEQSSPPVPKFTRNRSRKIENGVLAALYKLESSQQQGLLDSNSPLKETVLEEAATSEDMDNHVKVLVQLNTRSSKPKRYALNNKDKLALLKTYISKAENVSPNRVLLFFKENPVMDNDTVESLQITIADKIEACILSEEQIEDKPSDDTTEASFSIKVQGKHGQRDCFTFPVDPTEPIGNLFDKFASAKGLDKDDLQFTFDGEDVSPNDTPEDLGMESGDCIDVTGY